MLRKEKILVIHPQDKTTDFLKVIYKDLDCDIINHNVSHKILKESIISHDKIIFLGHGTNKGLWYDEKRILINSKLVYLLREKPNCVYIWCSANEFVEEYGLKGFSSGMIISEVDEAIDYCVKGNLEEIKYSNDFFAKVVSENVLLGCEEMEKNIKRDYTHETNEIVKFNNQSIYSYI